VSVAERQAAYVLDAEHRDFQLSCRRFVTDRVLPLVAKSEEEARFPSELWGELARQGLLGVAYPEALGGSGGDHLALAILSEELAKASGGIAITPLVSSYMAAPYLRDFGSESQQERFLRPILQGAKVAALAVTEPGAGSDVARIRTLASSATNGYVLRGTKMFITNGGLADVVVVAAKTDAGAGHRGISMFLVERGAAGLSVGRALRKMGWHSSDTRELAFDDCFVPGDHVLGEIGRGFYQIMSSFQTERLVVAGMGVGLAQTCLDDAIAYARRRVAFGRSLIELQSVAHTLAEMSADVHAARLVTYHAASLMDARADFIDAIAIAKLHAARVANTVADRAVQIFGGYGFIEETRVAMHYRDARILRIGAGTDEIQLEILAKRLVNR
jgi:acyl-CoA dehydrogenase